MLKIIEDKELKGKAVTITKSVRDTVVDIANHCKGKVSPHNGNWVGRDDLHTWDDVVKCFNTPWKTGLEKVKGILEEIVGEGIAPPESIRRKQRWNAEDGEVDIDRALRGDEFYMRDTTRRRIRAPQNVAILCNIGNTANFSADQIFWRGAATIAAVDLLEASGYNCEIWVWNHAKHCYGTSGYMGYGYGSRGRKKKWSHQAESADAGSFFFSARVKDCGEPMDTDKLISCLSAWFFRNVVFGMREVTQPGKFGAGSSGPTINGWIKYLDIMEGIQKVQVSATAYNRASAIEAAKAVLESVSQCIPV